MAYRIYLIFLSLITLVGIDTSNTMPELTFIPKIEAKERFKGFEIRVIRPRYFSKAGSLELGGQGVVVTNQTFIYTYMASGILNYHFTESFGAELGATFGFSVDKGDKSLLKESFNIKTQIIRTQSMLSAGLLWTPIYGKYQTSSGSVVYFDTFLYGGGGMSGIDYRFEHCFSEEKDAAASAQDVRADYVQQYPSFSFGLGQRFFLSRDSSVRWDVRGHALNIDAKDGSCVEDPNAESVVSLHWNLTAQFGYSIFF